MDLKFKVFLFVVYLLADKLRSAYYTKISPTSDKGNVYWLVLVCVWSHFWFIRRSDAICLPLTRAWGGESYDEAVGEAES